MHNIFQSFMIQNEEAVFWTICGVVFFCIVVCFILAMIELSNPFPNDIMGSDKGGCSK